MEADDDKAWHQPASSRTGENAGSAMPFESCAAVKDVAIQSVTVALFLLLHHIMKIIDLYDEMHCVVQRAGVRAVSQKQCAAERTQSS